MLNIDLIQVKVLFRNSHLLHIIYSLLSALPPSLNFLSISGDYIEGGLLTASYGYVGGHEGKSEYNWYLHEVNT
jgi:hypothetical protein